MPGWDVYYIMSWCNLNLIMWFPWGHSLWHSAKPSAFYLNMQNYLLFANNGGARVCKIANFRSNWKLKQCQLQVSVAIRLHTWQEYIWCFFSWFLNDFTRFVGDLDRRIFDIQAKTIPFDAIDKLEKRKNKTPDCK